MAHERPAIDLNAGDVPDLAELAEEIHRTKQPRVIRRADEELAVIAFSPRFGWVADRFGAAAVFGYSSGAILALLAAARGLPITRLVLYDPPFLGDEQSTRRFTALAEQLETLIASGRRGEAVALFQTQAVGIPPEVVEQQRHAPFWPSLEEIAHTLVYDATILGEMTALAAQLPTIAVPTLVLSGAENQERLLQAARAVAAAVPQAEYRNLPGQTHDLNPEALAPIVEPFVMGEEEMRR